MFKVGDMAVMPDSLPVKIKEGKYRTSERDTDVCRRRREKWKNAKKIGQKNEYGNRTNPGHVFQTRVPHVFFQQILDPQSKTVSNQQFRTLFKTPPPLP